MLNKSKSWLTTACLTFSCAGIVFLIMAFSTVPAGHVGVVTHFGAVQENILPEGLHIIIPFHTRIQRINTRVQKIEVNCTASSKDLQVVTSKVALNFFLSKEAANTIYQELGLDYAKTIIEPAIQESVKSSTAQYTAEQLITRRPEVKNDITLDLKKRLLRTNIKLTEFSIVNFNFSREFNRAIESKQVAEQAALRARNDLTRIKTEAEQVRAKADGEAQAKLALAKAEAEAQKLLSASLDQQVLQLRAIQKWDGNLPQVLGDDGASGAFFDVVGAMKNRDKRSPSRSKQNKAKRSALSVRPR